MSNEAATQMPQYECHKKVWALKIADVKQSEPEVDFPGGSYELIIDGTTFAPIRVPAEFVQQHKPQVGGYYVVYADGYKSYSPAKAFEEGYTLIK